MVFFKVGSTFVFIAPEMLLIVSACYFFICSCLSRWLYHLSYCVEPHNAACHISFQERIIFPWGNYWLNCCFFSKINNYDEKQLPPSEILEGGGRKERHLRFFSHHVSSSSRFNKWQGCPLVVRKRVAAIYSQPNAGLWKVSSIVLPSNVLASSCRKEPDRSEIITYRCPNSHPYSWRSKQNGNSVCSLTEVLTW